MVKSLISGIYEAIAFYYDKLRPNGKKVQNDGTIKRPGIGKFFATWLILYAIGYYFFLPLELVMRAILGIVVWAIVGRMLYRYATSAPKTTPSYQVPTYQNVASAPQAVKKKKHHHHKKKTPVSMDNIINSSRVVYDDDEEGDDENGEGQTPPPKNEEETSPFDDFAIGDVLYGLPFNPNKK